MAETLAYNFVGNDELSRVFEALDRVANKLDRTFNQLGDQATQAGRKLGIAGAEAKGAGDELKGVGDDAEKAGRKIDQLGDDMDKAALKAAVFDAQIRQARRSVRELSDEFVKTGDVDILNKLGLKQGRLAELEKLKTELGNIGKEVEKITGGNGNKGGLLNFAIDEFVGNLAGGISTAIRTGVRDGGEAFQEMFANNKLGLGIAAGVIVAAPMIGAAVNAAVLLGVGGGGLALGIVGAIQDPRVKGAWSGFGDFLKAGLAGASSSFVGPMQDAAVKVRATLSTIFTGMSSGLAALAPSFTRLLNGLAQMATRIDFASAFRAAAPIVDKLAEELPHMGDAMNSFLQSMERGGKGAQQGLHDMVTIIDDTIIAVGWLTEHFSKLWDFLRNNQIGKDLLDMLPFGPLFRLLDDTGSKGKKAGDDVKKGAEDGATGLGQMAYAASQAAIKVDDLNSAVDKMVNQQLAGKNAHLAFNQSLLDMAKSVKQNGTDLRDNTEAGIANQQGLIKMAQAAEADRQSVQQQTQDVGKATAVFDDHMVQVYKTAEALGLNKDQVDALIGSVKAVPHDTDANIMLKNAGKTQDDIREINRGLNTLDGKSVDTYITQHLSSVGSFYQSPDRLFDYPNRAYGGRVGNMAMGGRYKVGENGPEEVVLPDNAYVIPNNQMSRGAGPEVLDTVDIPLRGRDASGEVVFSALLRVARGRGKTLAQLIQAAS